MVWSLIHTKREEDFDNNNNKRVCCLLRLKKAVVPKGKAAKRGRRRRGGGGGGGPVLVVSRVVQRWCNNSSVTKARDYKSRYSTFRSASAASWRSIFFNNASEVA